MTPPPLPKPQNPREFWGYLISREHPTQPTPLFRNLLVAIANYITGNLKPLEIHCLTPDKIASFYHAVGGDLDDLFLGTPPPRLSSIYMTLGCSHSLQPAPNDDFVPPSIPALTSRGFVIWQTIQLLLDPEEHVPYLQEAVRIFPLKNPETGEFFPREIPKEAFPAAPDRETVRWHDEMFAKQQAKDALKEAAPAAAQVAASKHGKVQVPMPGEHADPGYAEYYRHHHHYVPPYQEHYVSSRSRKSRRSAPAPAPEPPVEEERYSRSAPGVVDLNNPFTHHHSRHHSNHATVETVFTSDSEGVHPHSRRQSRHHSRRGTREREREFAKPYRYENGVVTPVVPIFTNNSTAVIGDYVDGIRILTDQIPSSPPLPGPQHFHHNMGGHSNYHSPTVTAPDHSLSCSSSNSDIHGTYHSHHHRSPQHLSNSHLRDRSRPSRSPSPLRPNDPVLRKSVSACYYTQEPLVHTHSHSRSRSRSGGSGQQIRHDSPDMDSDVSDVHLNEGAQGWTLHNERERERSRLGEEGRRIKEERRQRRVAREAEKERVASWASYESGGGGGGGSSGGAGVRMSGGGRRYYRVGVEEVGGRGRYYYY